MSGYLDAYLRSGSKNTCEESKRIRSNVCLDPTQADSYPVQSKPKVGQGSSSKPDSMFVDPSASGIGNNTNTAGINPIQGAGLDTYATSTGYLPNPLREGDMNGFQSQLDMFQALSNTTGMGIGEEAHISPQSRSTPSSTSYPGRSGSVSGSFSYPSSKTTPEGEVGEMGPGAAYLSDYGASYEKGQWTGLGNMPPSFGQ